MKISTNFMNILFGEKILNTLSKFWNGDVSLRKSFWGGMLGVIVVNFIITYFFFRFVDLDKLEEQIIYLQYFQVPVVFFWWAGLWKSADKHKGKKIWPTLTKAFIAINLIYFVVKAIS